MRPNKEEKEQEEALKEALSRVELVQHQSQDRLMAVKSELLEAQKRISELEFRAQADSLKIENLELMVSSKSKQVAELRQQVVCF